MSIYKTDKIYKWVILVLLLFGGTIIYLTPEYWKIVVGCWLGFAAIFYFFRNNP